MRTSILVIVPCLAVGFGSLLALAQENKNSAICQDNPTAISELPLIDNPIVLEFPREWNRFKGVWHATCGSLVISERGCPGGSTGPCASMISNGQGRDCFEGSIDLALFLGLVAPGQYLVKWASVDGAAALGPFSINIEEPQGTDKEVYDKILLPGWASPLAKSDWMGWFMGVYTPKEPSAASQILDKFPTSTYAGYALARRTFDYSSPLFKPVPPLDQVHISRDQGKTVMAFAQSDFECYFKKLDTFMKGGHVPPSLATVLYCFYGDLLVQRGRFTEAEAAFKQAVKKEPSDPKGQAYFRRAQGFLQALGNNDVAPTAAKK